MPDKNIQMARAVAEAVGREGGSTYYVGGFVRDQLLGRENKDVDIEVHGIPVAALESILDGLGERTVMGASFGIMGMVKEWAGLGMTLPKKELIAYADALLNASALAKFQ